MPVRILPAAAGQKSCRGVAVGPIPEVAGILSGGVKRPNIRVKRPLCAGASGLSGFWRGGIRPFRPVVRCDIVRPPGSGRAGRCHPYSVLGVRIRLRGAAVRRERFGESGSGAIRRERTCGQGVSVRAVRGCYLLSAAGACSGSTWMATIVPSPKRARSLRSISTVRPWACSTSMRPSTRMWTSMEMHEPMRRVRRLCGSRTAGSAVTSCRISSSVSAGSDFSSSSPMPERSSSKAILKMKSETTMAAIGSAMRHLSPRK